MKGCDFQHISICLHLLMISLHLLVFPFIYLYFPSFTVFSFIYCLFLHLLSVPSFTDCSFIYIIINVGLTFAPVVCLAISLLILDTRVYSKILRYFAGDLLFQLQMQLQLAQLQPYARMETEIINIYVTFIYFR